MREIFDTEKITFLHVEELPEEGAMAVFSYPTNQLSSELRSQLKRNNESSASESVILLTVSEHGELSTAIRNGKEPFPFLTDNRCAAKLVNTLRQQLQKSYSLAR